MTLCPYGSLQAELPEVLTSSEPKFLATGEYSVLLKR
jgi:hypothetical protein